MHRSGQGQVTKGQLFTAVNMVMRHIFLGYFFERNSLDTVPNAYIWSLRRLKRSGQGQVTKGQVLCSDDYGHAIYVFGSFFKRNRLEMVWSGHWQVMCRGQVKVRSQKVKVIQWWILPCDTCFWVICRDELVRNGLKRSPSGHNTSQAHNSSYSAT